MDGWIRGERAGLSTDVNSIPRLAHSQNHDHSTWIECSRRPEQWEFRESREGRERCRIEVGQHPEELEMEVKKEKTDNSEV